MLLKRFLDSGGETGGAAPDQGDAYEHVALVLTNVTRLAAGRKLLLEPGRGTLGALASQLGSPSALRPSGCATALRNCCFRAEVGARFAPVRMLQHWHALPSCQHYTLRLLACHICLA